MTNERRNKNQNGLLIYHNGCTGPFIANDMVRSNLRESDIYNREKSSKARKKIRGTSERGRDNKPELLGEKNRKAGGFFKRLPPTELVQGFAICYVGVVSAFWVVFLLVK